MFQRDCIGKSLFILSVLLLLTIDYHFQGAMPQMFERTKAVFFSNIIGLLREAADLLYEMVKEIPCLTCPNKPQGSMVVLVRII